MTTCKKIELKISMALFIILLILFCSLTSITAADSNSDGVTIAGDIKDGISIITNDDFIFEKGNIDPGDEWSSKIVLKNNNHEHEMVVQLLSIENKIAEQMLYEYLDVTIAYEEQEIFHGSFADATEALKNYSYIIPAEQSKEMIVTVLFPIEANNEYMNAKLDTKWTFNVTFNVDPNTGDTTNVGFYLGTFAVAGGIIVILLVMVIRNKRKQ